MIIRRRWWGVLVQRTNRWAWFRSQDAALAGLMKLGFPGALHVLTTEAEASADITGSTTRLERAFRAALRLHRGEEWSIRRQRPLETT